ncbi:MAG: hypothetical protein HQ547_01125 [Candidatus Omnitrophica bacterium]|nr:hypothetical protein [Candidatus Omnitrophota bacterium]
MNTEKARLFTGLILLNLLIWYEVFGLGFIVGVVLTTMFFLIIRKK